MLSRHEAHSSRAHQSANALPYQSKHSRCGWLVLAPNLDEQSQQLALLFQVQKQGHRFVVQVFSTDRWLLDDRYPLQSSMDGHFLPS